MMKKMIVLLMFLVLAGSAFAVEELVFRGWLDNKDTLPVKDRNFTITAGSAGQLIYINSPASHISMGLYECGLIDYVRVCYDDTMWDENKSVRQSLIKIFTVPSEIEVTHTPEPADLLVGEESDVNVRIENLGEQDLIDLRYVLEVPDAFEILGYSGLTKKGNMLVKEIGRMTKSDVDFSFTVRAIDSFDENTFKANITFFDGFEKNTYNSDPVGIVSKHLIDPLMLFNATKINLDDTALFTLNLTNIADSSIDVDELTLDFPKGLQVIDYPSSMQKVSDRVYSWSDRLSKGAGDSFDFEVRGVLVGSSPVSLNAVYSEGSDVWTVRDERKAIDVYPLVRKLNVTFIYDKTTESFQESDFKIYIHNPNAEDEDTGEGLYFRDIEITVDTDLTHIPPIFIRRIGPEEFRIPYSFKIISPELSSRKDFPIRMTVTYKDPYGYVYTEEEDEKIRVDPVRGFDVDYDFSEKTVKSGEEATLTVTVTNKREVTLEDVVIYDLLPQSVLTEGIIKQTMNRMEPGRSYRVYTYKIIAPDVEMKKTMRLNTTIKYVYGDNSYTITKGTDFWVEPKGPGDKFKLKIEKSVPNKDFFRGEYMDLDYTVKNEDTEVFYGLVIEFPLQPECDIIGRTSYTVGNIYPGQKLTFDNIETIRPKVNGTVSLKKSVLHFTDKDGYRYSKTSNYINKEFEDGYIHGPMIIADKSAELVDGIINVTLVVENRGDTSSEVDILDYGRDWHVKMAPNERKVFAYSMEPNQTGKVAYDPMMVSYFYGALKFTTVSDPLVITIPAPKVIQDAQPPPEPEPEPPWWWRIILEKPIFVVVVLALLVFIFTYGFTYYNQVKEDRKKRKFEFREERK